MNAKEAVQIAANYTLDILPQATEILLEEIERSETEGKEIWLVTLSMYLPGRTFATSKDYKLFEVDSNSGQVLSMKIRTIK